MDNPNMFTPPTNREAMKSVVNKAEQQAQAMRFFMDMMIEDENCPPELKIELTILKTVKDLTESISKLVEPVVLDKGNRTLEEKKALLEYLAMVKTGIESYQYTNKTEE